MVQRSEEELVCRWRVRVGAVIVAEDGLRPPPRRRGSPPRAGGTLLLLRGSAMANAARSCSISSSSTALLLPLAFRRRSSFDSRNRATSCSRAAQESSGRVGKAPHVTTRRAARSNSWVDEGIARFAKWPSERQRLSCEKGCDLENSFFGPNKRGEVWKTRNDGSSPGVGHAIHLHV
jgi:hypothetical protein